MIITNQHNLPEPVFRALTHSDYSKGSSNRSVTQLIDSPRVRILRKEHDDEIFEDVSEMLWSVLGTSVHHMFEQHQPEGHIVEERLYAEVDDWIISGAIDVQRSEEDGSVTVLDYKCTSVWSIIYGKKEWHNQLNFYAWLVEQSKEIEVNRLQIVAVLRDWQRTKASVEENYPKAPLIIVDIPLWSQQVRDKYVRDRVRLHQHAVFERLTGGELPFAPIKSVGKRTAHSRWPKARSVPNVCSPTSNPLISSHNNQQPTSVSKSGSAKTPVAKTTGAAWRNLQSAQGGNVNDPLGTTPSSGKVVGMMQASTPKLHITVNGNRLSFYLADKHIGDMSTAEFYKMKPTEVWKALGVADVYQKGYLL